MRRLTMELGVPLGPGKFHEVVLVIHILTFILCLPKIPVFDIKMSILEIDRS